MAALVPSFLPAQTSPDAAFSAEPFVVDRSDVVYAMNADGTGYMQKTVAVRVQSEAALQQVGIVTMGFAASTQHVEFRYVRVRRPDGSVSETPLDGVMEQPLQATVQAPFYSDLKVAQLPVKNLNVGDTLEWEARVVTTRAEAPNEFWGAENFVTEGAVIREESVELRVPANKTVTVWTNPTLGSRPVESIDGNAKVYRWSASALKPTVGAAAEAAKEAQKKHVLTAAEETDAEQGKLPSMAWTTFPTWAAVGEWYRALELGRATPDDEIKAKVAEITAGKTTQEEKARAIYDYVSTQVRYIGVAFGIGRYQPHAAADVLNNQYGDCKDKATLLSAMLAAAGIPSDEALIGAGVRFNEAVPSPASFNHLITHLQLNGQDVWLDSTEEVAPYRMMYSVLRDREALVVTPAGVPALERTPKSTPFAAYQTWDASGSLDANGVSDSKITLKARGDEELILRAAARQVGPAQYGELTQKLLGAIGYGGTESGAVLSRPNDIDDPFQMSFDYRREKGGDWDNLKIIPQLAPDSLPYVDETTPPTTSIQLGNLRTETSTAAMKLPAGWTAELPEAVHEKSAYATYDLSYRWDKGTLYTERKIVILKEKVPVADWKAYKTFADAVGVGNETFVQLRRNDAPANAVRPAAVAGTSKGSVTELEQQLDSAYQYGELTKMDTIVQQIKQIDPKAPRLLAWEASIAFLRQHYTEAIEDDRQELARFPNEYDRYEAIAGIQLRQKDRAGAEGTLRDWSKADENSAQPFFELAQVLMEDGKLDDAVQAAKDGLSRVPEGNEKHDQGLLMLGTAQMKAGDKTDADVTLTTLLNHTSDPLMLNNAAFELADSGLELPLDAEKEEAAIAHLTDETKNWTLDESPVLLRQKTALLLASWDSMGWILYKQGKPEEAVSYLEAARMGGSDQTVITHLSQVRSALARGGDKAGPDPDSGKSDQDLRTIKLGTAGTLRGVAEYKLLLSHGQVERAELTGDRILEGGEALLKRAHFTNLFPAGSEAKLVRRGMVNCFSGKCELVLEP